MRNFLKRLWGKIWRKKPSNEFIFDEIVFIENNIEILEHKKLYYNHEDAFLTFKCPCGCGEEEMLWIEEKINRKKGMWAVDIKNGKMDLIGSVGSPFQCRSHYLITQNKVIWMGSL